MVIPVAFEYSLWQSLQDRLLLLVSSIKSQTGSIFHHFGLRFVIDWDEVNAVSFVLSNVLSFINNVTL